MTWYWYKCNVNKFTLCNSFSVNGALTWLEYRIIDTVMILQSCLKQKSVIHRPKSLALPSQLIGFQMQLKSFFCHLWRLVQSAAVVVPRDVVIWMTQGIMNVEGFAHRLHRESDTDKESESKIWLFYLDKLVVNGQCWYYLCFDLQPWRKTKIFKGVIQSLAFSYQSDCNQTIFKKYNIREHNCFAVSVSQMNLVVEIMALLKKKKGDRRGWYFGCFFYCIFANYQAQC